MAIIGAIIPSDQFTWCSETNCFVIEASTLEYLQGSRIRLYDDACDEGFGIYSMRTGKTVYFAYEGVSRDNDGDVAYSVYRSISREFPKLNVRVYNT